MSNGDFSIPNPHNEWIFSLLTIKDHKISNVMFLKRLPEIPEYQEMRHVMMTFARVPTQPMYSLSVTAWVRVYGYDKKLSLGIISDILIRCARNGVPSVSNRLSPVC